MLNIFGKECSRCKSSGVKCVTSGLFNLEPAELGERVIHVDGKAALIADGETIDNCPVILGSATIEQKVADIRSNLDLHHSL
jgi:hypothetical protein